jgi:DNA polymerase-1
VIVTRTDDLKRLVDHYVAQDAFVFDLETRYTPTSDEVEYEAELRAKSPSDRTDDEKAWLDEFKYRATDPAINEVIWFGLATHGRSDSIPCGHPHGRLLKPQRREKVTVQVAYGEDDPRCFTKSGKPRTAHVERTLPAVFSPPPLQIERHTVMEIVEPLFFSTTIEVANQNVGFDLRTIAKYYPRGVLPPGPYFELMVAMQIIDENAHRSWDLEEFTKTYLGHTYDKLGKEGVHNFPFFVAAKYAEQDARFVWLLRARALRLLQKHGLMDLFEFEMEVFPAIRRQEMVGVRIDVPKMDVLQTKFEEKIADIRDQLIVDYEVPPTFNLNSTDQKIDLIFKQHKVVPVKKTDGGKPSTDKDVLEKIASGNFQQRGRRGEGHTQGASDMPVAKIAGLLLENAAQVKLLGTYITGMRVKLNNDGYLHPTFTQHGTDTGRLSCREPNIHNIPRESDLRNLFIPPPGYKLVYVDWDQIQLRIISFLAREKVMREIFLSGRDIHLETAMRVLGKEADDVTGEERTTHGKIPNFLIAFGGTEYRLSIATGLPIDTCVGIIEAYFEALPRIKPWKERLLRNARERAVYDIVNGDRKLVVPPTCYTFLGRQRRLPALLLNPKAARNKDEWRYLNGKLNAAERVAVNFEVQGGEADVLKTAIIDLDNYITETGFPLKVTHTVHDEIIGICPDKHAEEALAVMERVMSSGINRRTGKPFLEDWVPLSAKGKIADMWEKG